jgi:hypothetical protein
MTKYDLRDTKWDNPDRVREACTLLGLDAMFLAMGHPTRNFPASQVIAWLEFRVKQVANFQADQAECTCTQQKSNSTSA